MLFLKHALLIAAAIIAGSGGEAWAQRTTATFVGTVVDSSDAALPGVDVQLTNQDTGGVTPQLTGVNGEFVFNYVPAGNYVLTISLSGFKTQTVRDIALGASQNLRRKFVLELGTLAETVTVSGSSPLLNAVSPEQRLEFEPREVQNLPAANRNITSMLVVGTGVTRQDTTEGGFGARLRLNGLGASAMSVTANGTDASGNAGSRMLSSYSGASKIDVMSMEAIGEVQIVKGLVPAEYANVLAGNLNISTKAGTNTWHGSGFYRYEGDELSGKPALLATKPESRWKQYGTSLGGPIVSNRAFFFAAYEGYDQKTATAHSVSVPTPLLRQQMLTALPFPETQILLDFYQLPTQPVSPTALIGTFVGPGRKTASDNHVDARADVRVGNGNLSLVFAAGNPALVAPQTLPTNARNFESQSRRVSTSYALARGRWSAETRFGYNDNKLTRVEDFGFVNDPGKPATIEFMRMVPAITFPGLTTVAAEWHIRGAAPSYSFEQQFTLVTAKHAFKFGGIYNQVQGGRTNPANPNVAFQSITDLLNNDPSGVSYNGGSPSNIWKMKNFGFFVQDDWRVNSRLVINAGLRYDFFGRFVAKGDTDVPAAFYNLDGLPGSNFAFGPVRDAANPVENDAGLNLGPRIGFAYTLDETGNNVLRGGYGLMFQPTDAQGFEAGVQTSTIVPRRRDFSRAEAAALGLRWPVYNEDMIGMFQTINSGNPEVTVLMDPHIQGPYAMVYTLGFQRALNPYIVFEAAYLGTVGEKYPLPRQYNAVDRVTGIRPNPKLNQDVYYDNAGHTRYHSFQTSLRQRTNKNLTFSVNYTLGKSWGLSGGDGAPTFIGDSFQATQDFFNPEAEWGPATGDVRHAFVSSAIYEIPEDWFSSSVVKGLLGRWQAAVIFRALSGQPFNITQTSQAPGSRPDLIDADNAINQDCCDVRGGKLQYLNVAAFAPVPVSTVSRATVRPGTTPSLGLRLPGYRTVDLSLSKFFGLGVGRSRLEVRADMLNLFDLVNVTGISSNISSANFGQVTATGDARIVQLQARLSF